jgi:hypothetical protein
MVITRFIVMFVVYVLLLKFVEIINVFLIPPMMNVASVWRWIIKVVVDQVLLISRIIKVAFSLINNTFDKWNTDLSCKTTIGSYK